MPLQKTIWKCLIVRAIKKMWVLRCFYVVCEMKMTAKKSPQIEVYNKPLELGM
jgi:hypothetical protein